MLMYLSDRPNAYLDEVALALFDEFNVDIHPNTVGLYL